MTGEYKYVLERRVERDLELQHDGYSSCYSSDEEHDRRREKQSRRSSKRKLEHGSGSRKDDLKENGVSQGVAILHERQEVDTTTAPTTVLHSVTIRQIFGLRFSSDSDVFKLLS